MIDDNLAFLMLAINDTDGCFYVRLSSRFGFFYWNINIQADDLSHSQHFYVFSFTVRDSQTGADKYVSKVWRQSLRYQNPKQTSLSSIRTDEKSLWIWLLNVTKQQKNWRREDEMGSRLQVVVLIFCFKGSIFIFESQRRIRGDFNRMALPQMTYSNTSWRFKAEAEVSGREKLSYPNRMRFMLAGRFGCVLSKLFQILGGLQFHPL